MQAVLVMFRNDGERRSFSISREMTVIGRRQDCDLMIPLGEISRKHCRIIRDSDGLRLEDLGSSNGTFHNGRRVQEAVLEAGDTIQVGPVAFVVQIDGVPAEEDMRPRLGGAAMADEDELEALPDDDDLERTPGTELDDSGAGTLKSSSLESDDLETLEEDELSLDDEPKRAKSHDSGELGALSTDDSNSNIDALDAEIGENLELDDDPLAGMDDSTAGDISLDDDKPKRRSK